MSEPEIDPRRLLIFREVIREGGLTGAANQLGLTTSAVSQQLSKFEKETGIPLVTRNRNRIAPTARGMKLLKHADAVAASIASAASALRGDTLSSAPRTIRMAVVGSLLEMFALPIQEEAGGRVLCSRDMTLDEAEEALSADEVDWLFTLGGVGPVAKNLRELARVTEPLVVVVPRAWSVNSPGDLTSRPWARPAVLSDDAFQGRLPEVLRAKPEIRHITATSAGALALARRGLVATITTQYAANLEGRELAIAHTMPTMGDLAAVLMTPRRADDE